MDTSDLSLARAAELISLGELSCAEYTRGLLDRIDEYTNLNAFITVRPDALLKAADGADQARARGDSSGPLHGVPIAVKDNIDTANLPTTGGTPALRMHQPAADADTVSALRQAGALILGKTNLHELAYGVTSENGAFGAVRNPYHGDRIAGGSSGGTAAAVAARLAPAGLGTDTGGSVRIPASLCGVAGLRPTAGRYSQRGVVLLSHTRDTVGPLARTVEDLALLDAVLARGARPPSPPLDAGADLNLAGHRLGVIRRPFTEGLADDVADVFERRLTELAGHGVDIVEVASPDGLDELIVKAGFPIAFHETTVDLGRYLETSDLAITVDEMVDRCASPDVRGILGGLLGDGAVPEMEYRAAISVHRPALDDRMRTMFAHHRLSAVAWPTTPLTAAPIGTDEVRLGAELTSPFLAYTRTTNPGSIIGWPGVTVPAGLDGSGLPIGFALDGAPGGDRLLLRIARACERLFGTLPPPA